jgi:RNA polymerase sigma-70 factor (ECF subfamily)
METLLQNFEAVALPHLSAAYNLARWLTRNGTDAEDVVQEAYFRAFKSFHSFHGSNGRPWMLAIVRNTCYTWMRQNRAPELLTAPDADWHAIADNHLNPERLLLKEAGNELVRQAVEELPPEFREVIVLRELEGLSYKQIATVAEIPLGTVMSRLARARNRLQQKLRSHGKEEITTLTTVVAPNEQTHATRRC